MFEVSEVFWREVIRGRAAVLLKVTEVWEECKEILQDCLHVLGEKDRLEDGAEA